MRRFTASTLIAALLFGVVGLAHAQETSDPDELFRQARELAFSGQREQGRALAYRILERSPGYHDVRIFIARTYSWDGEYDKARRELSQVLQASPDYTDARRAIVDVESWSGDYERALDEADEGLEYDPGDEQLLYKKARVLWNLERVDEAMLVTQDLLRINPGNSQARALLQSLDLFQIRNELSGSYFFDRLSDISNWQTASMQLSRQFSFGSVLGRVNYARRFGGAARQYEIDAYPHIAEGLYAYANYGYSRNSFFPRHRIGGEVFASLPKATEFSAGFRHLRFRQSTVTIITGSFGWYRGNYWFSLRPYITPGDGSASASLHFTVRRYFSDADNYIGFRVGGGSSPDEAENVIDISRLRHASTAFNWERTLVPTVLLSIGAGYSWEEFRFDRARHHIWIGGGMRKRF